MKAMGGFATLPKRKKTPPVMSYTLGNALAAHVSSEREDTGNVGVRE